MMNEIPRCCEATCEVDNVPEYAIYKSYWTVTPSGGRLWFYGAFDTYNAANKAKTADQIVVEFDHAIHNRRRRRENER